MSDFLFYLGRFALAVLGFLAASLAAGAFISLIALGRESTFGDYSLDIVGASATLSVIVGAVVAYHSFLPTLVVILIAEFFTKRDWLFYAIGGMIIGLANDVLIWTVSPAQGFDPFFTMVLAGGGIIAGFVYWLIAGRSAGPRR